MKSGIIKLMDKHGKCSQSVKYDSPAFRKETIERWKKLYSKAFNDCFLQIVPYADEKLVDLDGTNIKPLNHHQKH